MFEETSRFVREVFGSPEGFIPLHEPFFQGEEEDFVVDALRSTFVSSVGKYVDQFEEELAKYTGNKRAIATGTGTAALHVSLILAGAEKGTEVITQALSFVATANAILYCNASPIFLDVERDSMGLSPESLRVFLDEKTEVNDQGQTINKQTRRRIVACVPMHTFGFPARIHEIASLCKARGITLVEDAAESIGSRVGEVHTGSFGSIGVFSLNGNKTITCGGGGALVTDDDMLADAAKHMTTTAKRPHRWEYYHDVVGYNYRMPNLNAALACAQLKQLPCILEKKRALADAYQEFFSDSAIRFRSERAGTTANYWLNTVELKGREERDKFLEHTNQNGVMTRPIWTPLNELPMFEQCETDDLEETRWLADRVVNIPSSAK